MTPLDDNAWRLGESPDAWPRSRYSGAALYPGQMAISLIVSWRELFGHSYIAFEWFADEVIGPRVQQRRHEIYHLRADATDEERRRGVERPGSSEFVSWSTRPATVVRETDPAFFPLRDSEGRTQAAFFRSWLVPFAAGWRGRTAAAAALGAPPSYNFFELGGGLNCARWVLQLAALAGIAWGRPETPWLAIPKRLVPGGAAVEDEDVMWQRRTTAAAS